uniref:radical SAM protein n=1 Tax=Agathobacter sp. TaxID=2021311 RepID=UPI004055D44F
MKVCIRSSGDYGQKAFELIVNNFNCEVICFMEEINFIKSGNVLGRPVYSQYKVVELYQKQEIDCIIVPGGISVVGLLSIQCELKGFGIKDEDIWIIPVDIMLNPSIKLSAIEREKIKNHHEFNYLPYLEFHVADHCNLNCDNCAHFSSLVKDRIFAEYEEVCRDFKRLKELVDGIQVIRILGGECLLNPDLDKYIELVGNIYPNAKLSIVTNGLLVRTMQDELINVLKKYDVNVTISSYRPLWGKMDEVALFLKAKKLKYSITQPFSYFFKVMDLENKTTFPYKSLENLPACECKNLYKGHMAICPTVCYSGYYDAYYGIETMKEMCQSGFVDIYKVKSFEELQRKITTPCELCNYCTVYRAIQDKELQETWKQL